MKGIYPWQSLDAKPRARRGPGHQYGVRDTVCSACHKLFRKTDVTQGICAWCAWELQASDDRIVVHSLEE